MYNKPPNKVLKHLKKYFLCTLELIENTLKWSKNAVEYEATPNVKYSIGINDKASLSIFH